MTVTHEATKEMISELRRMSNRTGNKQAEKIMRDGAAWLEDVESDRVELQNENEKLRQKLADKDEQLAGWKALVDRIQGGTETKSVADERNPKPEKNKRYDYSAVLTRFVQGDGEILRIPTKNADRTGKYNERKPTIRHPSFYTMRDTINRMGSPVSAFYDDATCEIVLVKQGGSIMIYGRKDPQDIAPVAYCIHCGGEIYPGAAAYIPAEYAGMLHEECVKDWIYETYANVLGVRCGVNTR